VAGKGSLEFLQQRFPNDIRRATPGSIVYGVLCDEQGFALDDILIYGAPNDEYFLIVNAANVDKDINALRARASGSVEIVDLSHRMACVAVQGPRSEHVLEQLFGFALKSMPYYTHKTEQFRGQSVWVSRTGYTGEDGFEIFSSNEMIGAIWDRLLIDGRAQGALPAGLGARNTLRLEAGNVLYGHELDDRTTPLEAGLSFAVDFKKGSFMGREALWAQKVNGVKKKLIGFKMKDRSVPRENYPIAKDGMRIGRVTSGSYAPTVGVGIGMGFVEAGAATLGDLVQIEIHGRMAEAEVVRRPFIELKHRK
jgi:aminomethyltransferase